MRVAIIGGGVSGLVSAYKLSKNHKITIYEKSNEIGGLLSSYHRDQYTLEKYYHHFFSGDTQFLALLDELGLSKKVLWLHGSTGTYQNGALSPLTTPFEILIYPHLTLSEKYRLAVFTKRAKTFDLARLDAIPAEAFLIEQLGEKIYRSFFRPLLNSKFGQNAEKISAAWIVSRVAIRSDRNFLGERLGYLQRGFYSFINALSEAITMAGGEIRVNTPVSSLVREEGRWIVNGEVYDAVIATIAPGILKSLGLDTPEIPYQGAACLTLGLVRPVTRGIYWINLYDQAPYGAVIAHTCFAPRSWYGEDIVYLASYYTQPPSPDLKDRMIDDFCQKFSVKRDEIVWAEMAQDPYAGPLYVAGYRDLVRTISVPAITLAGMFSVENYPERSIEGSVRAGLRAAREVEQLHLPWGRSL